MLEIEYKNIRNAMVLIYCRINTMNRRKKKIFKYKWRKKIPHIYTKSGQTLYFFKKPKTWKI